MADEETTEAEDLMEFFVKEVDRDARLPERDYLELKTQVVIALALEGINKSLVSLLEILGVRGNEP